VEIEKQLFKNTSYAMEIIIQYMPLLNNKRIDTISRKASLRSQ